MRQRRRHEQRRRGAADAGVPPGEMPRVSSARPRKG
jgi:hypothetical protein